MAVPWAEKMVDKWVDKMAAEMAALTGETMVGKSVVAKAETMAVW